MNIGVALFCGIVVGFFVSRGGIGTAVIPESREIRMPDPAYVFLNPLLDCEVSNPDQEFSELPRLNEKLNTVIEKALRKGAVSEVGVYFRDLNNGPWRGINANSDFSPASLLKLPIMIAYLKWAEREPRLLDRVVSYTGPAADYDTPQPETPVTLALTVGSSYRIQDLIERMILYSDNNAKDLLQENLPDGFMEKVFADLGVNSTILTNSENSVSVRDYASFFRILYNASYLNRIYSNLALEYLGRSTFDRGLVAGIPKGIPVAHKYGVRNVDDDNSIRQLHDCGIIYYPKRPYLLCIMTRGKTFTTMASTISDLSRVVYDEVSSGK